MGKPASIVTIKGIKCDAPNCDYRDDDAPGNEDISAFLNRPCPKCGAPLLTEADLAAIRLVQFTSHAINVEFGESSDDARYIELLDPEGMDGTGKIQLLPIRSPEPV
jgi:hypothetical protein